MSSENHPICVVEDNPSIRKLFCLLLNKAKFETVDFDNGKAAIEWLKTHQPLGVIVDILLPDLNGTEILSTIRSMPSGGTIPFIAVTGFAQANDRDRYMGLGFDDYISKPVNTATFVGQVKSVIENKK